MNGEPSVWACQSRGIAAVAPLTGEGTPPSAEMVEELKQFNWAWERVRVVYDRDPTGEEGARRTVLALREAGIEAVALQLPAWLGEKADVDLLHRATGARLGEELAALPELPLLAPVLKPMKALAPRKPVVSIAELVGEPEETVRYIVDGLLPSGATSLLCGKPKVGKSTLARSIALAVARGEPVLGRQTTRTPVLYLVLEEKRAEVARWFRTAGVTDEPLWVFIGTEVEDPLAFFAAEARQRGVGLVIVDPLHALLKSGDINDYSRVNEAIKPLVEVARTGLHLMFVHHMGKGERSGGDRVLGSTALFGAVDALITMTREQGVFVVESIQRYGTDLEPTAVQRDERTGLVTAIGPVEEAKDGPTREAILEYLGDDERTEEEIRAALGRDQGSVVRALRQLMRSTDPRRGLSRSGGGRKGDPFRYRRYGGPSILSDAWREEAHPQTGNGNMSGEGSHVQTGNENI